MKKIALLCPVLLFLSVTLNCQITKGNWMVGGTGSYTSEKDIIPGSPTSKYTSASILPDIGYFVADKFVTGVNLDFGFSKVKSTRASSIKHYGLGPFARYYFLEKDHIVNLFIQGNFNYNFGRYDNFGMIDHNSAYHYSFSGGPVIFFNSSVGLELTGGWYYSKYNDSKTSSNLFKIAIGFQIHLQK